MSLRPFNYRRRWTSEPHGNFGYGTLNKTSVIKSDLKHKDGLRVQWKAWKRTTDGVPLDIKATGPQVWFVTVTINDDLSLALRGTPRAAVVSRLKLIVEQLCLGDLMEEV